MDALDERKEKILYAIIQNYLETGEPVGSRTISKNSELNLSSATIRNEMSDLEELGYIVQPHTSAGRIPSDKGYRFYVDRLMAEKDQEVSDIKELMIEKTEKMEKLLKQVVKVLANNTQYATMISAPALSKSSVKFVQLSAVDEHHILSVVVMNGNLVKNKIIEVDKPLDNENLLKLNMLLNTNLNGLTVSQINLGLITMLKEQAGIHEDIIAQVLNTVAETIKDSDEGLE
ncbi:MAG: heat-inducible transcription repressor HrcA, partial [Lachnospiraceae bacterium]|nr:heat-inducible transcription repressor HrcA [Lachnospiraceae bacterium]